MKNEITEEVKKQIKLVTEGVKRLSDSNFDYKSTLEDVFFSALGNTITMGAKLDRVLNFVVDDHGNNLLLFFYLHGLPGTVHRLIDFSSADCIKHINNAGDSILSLAVLFDNRYIVEKIYHCLVSEDEGVKTGTDKYLSEEFLRYNVAGNRPIDYILTRYFPDIYNPYKPKKRYFPDDIYKSYKPETR
jgi:hypothetical protein